MNKETAEFVARVAFKNASELSKLVPILKDTLAPDEYEKIATSIAKISGLVAKEILFDIFDEHPDIDANLKNTIEKYGKLP
jgi:fibrillarin-like rRNA methylase